MIIRIYIICLLIVLSQAIGLIAVPTFSYDSSNKNQWPVRISPSVDTSIPNWFKPMKSNNLNDWLAILPAHLQKYKTQEQFMVIPDMGMITPIVELKSDSADFKSAKQWWNFDYNKYLVGGPTIYPGTASVWDPGNTFIFAHSNYWRNSPGDFKTIFRLTYNIEKGDSILYYKKIGWKRILYSYKVTDSLLVNETDVWVMLPKKGKKELTLSACRPIGTSLQRRINKAELVSESVLDYEIGTGSGAIQAPNTTSWSNDLWAIIYQPASTQAKQLALDAARKIILTQ